MALKDEIATFLRTDVNIKKINFSFRTFKVYPSAYQKDVADAVAKGEIKVRINKRLSAAVGASYVMNYDSLELPPSFNLKKMRDQAFLVHECTHAHLDIQETGWHSGYENEAVAYLAEAVFLEAAEHEPLGSETIRVVSHRIAKTILAGGYVVSGADATLLTTEVSAHSHYKGKSKILSSGFKRTLIDKVLR